MEIKKYMDDMGVAVRKAATGFSSVESKTKDRLIADIGKQLNNNREQILKSNEIDIKHAKERDLNIASIDRLLLDNDRIDSMIQSIEEVVKLPDPIGEKIEEWTRPNGLNIAKVSVPLGVIGIIYESRPNVTSDAAALCLKSGNAVVLRGGSESIETNKSIHDSISVALAENNIDPNTVQLVKDPDREAVDLMLKGLDGNLDILVPRGGRNLVAKVKSDARIPIIGHLEGICHVYIQKSSKIDEAIQIVINSKMRRTGICGAAETILIDRDCVETHLGPLIDALKESGCEIRGDKDVALLDEEIIKATESDWSTEYLDAIVSIKIISDVEEAVQHINEYGSGHTESIVSNNSKDIDYFFNHLQSAIILSNASTQFADGGEFGMGAEIGISTDKIHARGPVGAKQLTSYKYLVHGSGQIRSI
ncbi:MAG: glutamate-5-semialdehyde dehydrogenase [Gammaproteobacteria bacterium]